MGKDKVYKSDIGLWGTSSFFMSFPFKSGIIYRDKASPNSNIRANTHF
jgi:hypothetical protein